jgi:protein phosphatase 1G
MEYKLDKKLAPEHQMITAVPEIKTIPITSDLKFLFIACDGIWDCLTSQEAAEFIGERVEKYRKAGKLSGIVEQMFDTIIASDVASSEGIGCDNMTAVIIMFKNDE